LIRNGEVLNPESYLSYKVDRRGTRFSRVNPEFLNEELKKGTAIHILGVEEFKEELNVLVENIENELLTKIEATIHIGINESTGFHPHYDAHDVFVLQISGRKNWKLYGFIESYPVRIGPSIKTEIHNTPIWEGILEQGDMLYLPRGIWHSAEAFKEPAMHVSIGMTNPLAYDYLIWLVNNLKAFELVRMDIPRLNGEKEEKEFIEKIKKILVEDVNKKTLKAFISEYSQKKIKRRFQLPNIF
jgi:ribosomal protein L16 Arg81 hydroxylase